MTNQHPIAPPPELVQQWRKSGPADAAVNNAYEQHIATQAARWGSDQELEACCEVLARELICDGKHVATDLQAARRPKPPSLKEQALAKLAAMERLWEASGNKPSDLVRRALEQLDD